MISSYELAGFESGRMLQQGSLVLSKFTTDKFLWKCESKMKILTVSPEITGNFLSKREKGTLEKTKKNTRFFSLMWIMFGFDLGCKQCSLLGSRCSEGTGNCKFRLGGHLFCVPHSKSKPTKRLHEHLPLWLPSSREMKGAWPPNSLNAAQRWLQSALRCLGWKCPHQDRPEQPQREDEGASPRGCFHKTWRPLNRKSFYQ